jgi:hypothetical protein
MPGFSSSIVSQLLMTDRITIAAAASLFPGRERVRENGFAIDRRGSGARESSSAHEPLDAFGGDSMGNPVQRCPALLASEPDDPIMGLGRGFPTGAGALGRRAKTLNPMSAGRKRSNGMAIR